MARSLFAILNNRFGKPVDAITRRQMLAGTLAASAGLLISRSPVLGELARRASAGKSVVVVGGGFSGLACAFELKAAGYDVSVIEARERVGGRVLSFNSTIGSEFIKGRSVEGGGELIGSNHPAWVNYAKSFNLEFLDVFADEENEAPIVIGGKRLTSEESEKLWKEMEEANNNLNALSANINEDEPWKSPDAETLDKRSIQDWIDKLEASDLCKKALSAEHSANNGVPSSRASLLCMLAAVKGGGLEKYWSDSEVYRCKGGNQQLALKLADGIGKSRVVMGLAVKEIDVKADKVITRCSDNRTLESDHIVLAVPPSVWRKIVFAQSLPASLAPQMGVNVKYLAHVKTKFWKEAKLASDSFSDGPASMTWDATDGQEGDENACLTTFSGGDAAAACREFPKAERDAKYREQIEKWYADFGKNFVAARFMDWPAEPWTGAGYSFPAPGQVTTHGPVMRNGLGRLHFAGEHTCYKFVGYMEGALNSGVSLAKRIAMKDGVLK